MMQGDAYELPLFIQSDDGLITQQSVSEVVVSIGNLTKTLTNGDLQFDKESGAILVRLSQQDTFSLVGREEVQARVKFTNGEVKGVVFGELFVDKSTSTEVI